MGLTCQCWFCQELWSQEAWTSGQLGLTVLLGFRTDGYSPGLWRPEAPQEEHGNLATCSLLQSLAAGTTKGFAGNCWKDPVPFVSHSMQPACHDQKPIPQLPPSPPWHCLLEPKPQSCEPAPTPADPFYCEPLLLD